jgi:hypothetical protein
MHAGNAKTRAKTSASPRFFVFFSHASTHYTDLLKYLPLPVLTVQHRANAACPSCVSVVKVLFQGCEGKLELLHFRATDY